MTIGYTLLLAMAGGSGGSGQQQQSPAFMAVWIGLMLVLFYVMAIRPQQRREKERRALLEAVKTGDRVIFGGGLVGMVTNVKEKSIVVKIADGVKVEALRGSVTQVLQDGATLNEEPTQA